MGHRRGVWRRVRESFLGRVTFHLTSEHLARQREEVMHSDKSKQHTQQPRRERVWPLRD